MAKNPKISTGFKKLFGLLPVLLVLAAFFLASPCVAQDEDILNMLFVHLPGGQFEMGSTLPLVSQDEKPQHWVNVTEFYLKKTEVTRGEWRAVMGQDNQPWLAQDGQPYTNVYMPPAPQSDDDYPATYISFPSAIAFCVKLNQAFGENRFRLPTEAQWEYACRATSTEVQTPFSGAITPDNLVDYAWYLENTALAGEPWPHTVASKLPTVFPMNAPEADREYYDMHGNVAEWTLDWYEAYPQHSAQGEGDSRVIRGGSFLARAAVDQSQDCRCGNRDLGSFQYLKSADVGFRLVYTTTPFYNLPGAAFDQGGGGGGGGEPFTPTSSTSDSGDGGGGGGCFVRAATLPNR